MGHVGYGGYGGGGAGMEMGLNDGSLPPDVMLDVPRLDYAAISSENRERNR